MRAEEKQRKPADLFLDTHTLTHSSTKRPFINTSLHRADSRAVRVPPRGSSVYYTSQLKGCAQEQQSYGCCGLRLGEDKSRVYLGGMEK